MNHETRMDQVKKAFEEFETKGSADRLFEMLADDVTWRATAPVGTAMEGTFRGRDGVAEYFGRAQGVVEIVTAATTDYFERGDRVVVLGTERLRLRATGAERALDWAMVMTFARGRIADVVVIEDLSLLLGAA